jgi:hypothetical protein
LDLSILAKWNAIDVVPRILSFTNSRSPLECGSAEVGLLTGRGELEVHLRFKSSACKVYLSSKVASVKFALELKTDLREVHGALKTT